MEETNAKSTGKTTKKKKREKENVLIEFVHTFFTILNVCGHVLLTMFIGLVHTKGPILVDPPSPLSELSTMSILARSRIMAELSKAAYEDTQTATETAKTLGFKVVEFYEDGSAQGYRFVSDHDIVIACRGTETHELGDILADLKIRRVPACIDCADVPGKVHRGFRGEAYRLWDKVHPDILAQADGGHKLWFTGHSLGAAMATLLATFAQQTEDALNVAGMVTFGSPRVGNREFANFTNETAPEYLRWVNNDDAVTKVPLNLFGNYYHCGKLMYLDEDGDYLNDVSWLRIHVDRVLGKLSHVFLIWTMDVSDVSDHFMDNYLGKITKLALAEEEAAQNTK